MRSAWKINIGATVIPLILALAVVAALSSCSSSPKTTRQPASDEDALIRIFSQAITKDSALGSEAAVEDAMNVLVRENSETLSNKPIRSLEDIASLEEAEQKKILSRLVKLPDFSEKLAINMDAVQAARQEAIESLESAKGVKTEAIADIHAQSPSTEETPNDLHFSKALNRNPALKEEVSLMIHDNAEIQNKTGTAVLDQGCDQLERPESVQNLAAEISGVRRDVASGSAKDSETVAKSLEKNMSETQGTTPEESHHNICELSKKDGCAVFTPAMCR
jgi:hypothetical protein